MTATPLPTGSTVLLRVSFYRQPEVFDINARLVWSREDKRPGGDSGGAHRFLIHGVQFSEMPAAQRMRLHQILESAEFQVVFAPTSGEFDHLMSDLREDLKRLVERFGQPS